MALALVAAAIIGGCSARPFAKKAGATASGGEATRGDVQDSGQRQELEELLSIQ